MNDPGEEPVGKKRQALCPASGYCTPEQSVIGDTCYNDASQKLLQCYKCLYLDKESIPLIQSQYPEFDMCNELDAGTGGSAGTAGSAGSAGEGGNAGIAGSAGTAGFAGEAGSAGTAGSSGQGEQDAGVDASVCNDGQTLDCTAQCPEGYDGEQYCNQGTWGACVCVPWEPDGGTGGSAGTAGSAGSAGEGGNAGDAGSAGEAGNAGIAGSAGTAGFAGEAGSAGTAGSSGQGEQDAGVDVTVCPYELGQVCSPPGTYECDETVRCSCLLETETDSGLLYQSYWSDPMAPGIYECLNPCQWSVPCSLGGYDECETCMGPALGGASEVTEIFQCRGGYLFRPEMEIPGIPMCPPSTDAGAGDAEAGASDGGSDYGPVSSVACEQDEVYKTDLLQVPNNGLYLVYMSPAYPQPLHNALYDWTDYGNNGHGGWGGWEDTAWQMRCVTGSTQQTPIICPMDKNAFYLREIMPKLVLPESVDNCSVYHEGQSLYWCNSVLDKADTDKLFCSGTWRIYQDGSLLDEYVDAPGEKPEPSSLFKKIVKAPGDPDSSYTTYRVHMGILWTP